MITLGLRALLREILKEVGELEGIESYSFSKISNDMYEFETEQGDKVRVKFALYPLTYIEDSLPSDIDSSGTFINIEFEVENQDTQFRKSTYSYLIKILKTVFNITLDYLKINHPKYILIAATNKFKEKSSEELDLQKGKLYQAIMLKNINKLPKYNGTWGYRKLHNVLGIEGDAILLENGFKPKQINK
jgi:hypothetical protein